MDLIEQIHSMDPKEHIVIGTILRKYQTVKLNENKSGLMINMNTVPIEALNEIRTYLDYIRTQNNVLQKIEEETKELKKGFF